MELRYWFVVLKYNTQKGNGTSNVGQIGEYLNQKEVCDQFLKNNKDVVEGTIVITNFIELSLIDFNNFFSINEN